MSRFTYIRFFDEIGIDDIPLVGGKNASLGEMYQALVPQGVYGYQMVLPSPPKPTTYYWTKTNYEMNFTA